MKRRSIVLTAAIVVTSVLSTSFAILPTFVLAAEQAVSPERNPPGDISDSQVFIAYTGPGFSMQVPEGWSRNNVAGGATFSDKYNLIAVTIADAPVAPTVESAKLDEAAAMSASGHAVEITGIKSVALDGGEAIQIEYQSNSDPNDVTGKQVRLERVRYLYFKGGKLVRLDMAAPAGADNVDQWLVMANSVKLD
ncbi:hypothetical protein [Devosia sp.]|uniref:hypothetical protein n=1 Tax=Devosia sp. TaxID=1871048 RepID=UPI003BA90E09